MKFLILSVVVLGAACCAMGLTVQECAAKAKECKRFVAPLARGGHSREQFLNTIKNTPLGDLCTAAQGFLSCNRDILDNPECNQYEQVSKYEALYTRLNNAVTFTCVKERDAVERFIPCLTSRQFFRRIAHCKKTNPCNSNGSWDCAQTAVADTCRNAEITSWFNSRVPVFKANHPGCGEDSLLRKFYGAMRGQQ